MKISTKLATIKAVPAPATAIAKAMAKAIKTEPAISGHKAADVMAALHDAVVAAGTMLDCCRKAAAAAVAQFNPALSAEKNVNAIMRLYEDDFAGNANVKANFKDVLWLLAAGDTPLTFTVDGVEKHATGKDAAKMAKHPMKAAASVARRALGASATNTRAPGAGRKRKPAGKVASPTQPTAASKVSKAGKAGPVMVTPAEEVFLDNLAAFLSDPDMIARIKIVCSENGFTLSKKPAKK